MSASRSVVSSVSVTTCLIILSATVIRSLPSRSSGQHIPRFVRPSTTAAERRRSLCGPGSPRVPVGRWARDRHGELKAASRARLRFDADPAAVQLDDLTGDDEAEPRPSRATRDAAPDLRKLAEEPVQVGGLNTI